MKCRWFRGYARCTGNNAYRIDKERSQNSIPRVGKTSFIMITLRLHPMSWNRQWTTAAVPISQLALVCLPPW